MKLNNKSNEGVYANWDVGGLIDRVEELCEVLQQSDTQIAFIFVTKKKLQGTKNTGNYSII
jgi:hypothetical protein